MRANQKEYRISIPVPKSNEQTQAERILAYLKAGNKLTQLEALKKFGCMRLPSRIWDIKQTGVEVQRNFTKTRTGKCVAEYYL